MNHREDFKAIRARADMLITKAELFDALMLALTQETGEFRRILTRCRKLYEAEARERIETKRNNRND